MPQFNDDDYDLLDCLQSGETKYLNRRLREISSISGEALEYMAKLFEANPASRSSCKKRLGFLPWEKRKRLLPASRPQLSAGLWTALNSADGATLASELRNMQVIEGDALETMRRLFEGDRKIKCFFKKQLGFVGWGRGRPALDPALREVEDWNVARLLPQILSREGKIANTVEEVTNITAVGRTRVWKIVKDLKAKNLL
jgi:hypothetical protein